MLVKWQLYTMMIHGCPPLLLFYLTFPDPNSLGIVFVCNIVQPTADTNNDLGGVNWSTRSANYIETKIHQKIMLT